MPCALQNSLTVSASLSGAKRSWRCRRAGLRLRREGEVICLVPFRVAQTDRAKGCPLGYGLRLIFLLQLRLKGSDAPAY